LDIFEILSNVLENKKSAFFYTPAIYKNAKSYWFRKPDKSNIIFNPNAIDLAFKNIQLDLEKQSFGYCLIPYETGYFFEESLRSYLPENYNLPFLEFNHFKESEFVEIKSRDLSFKNYEKHISEKILSIENFELNTARDTYLTSIRKIKAYIEKGDTYQVNYTVKGKYQVNGEIIHLIYELLFNQSAGYTTIINVGDKLVISISPELFIDVNGYNVIAKPMKGTTKRGKNIKEDEERLTELKADKKNRAENVMIVDLLRNDLGKICEFDSINASSLYDIEQYETLFQMTSTVSGKLKTKDLKVILENIFPCGSITGAPKISTMKIIKELETENRGYYTGTIGLFVNERGMFNIPIRTLVLDPKTKQGEIGIGSGVVWDSEPEEEYKETLLKANFLLKPEKNFEIFETILLENGEYFLLQSHLSRLNSTASYFMFYYDEKKIKSKLRVLSNSLNSDKYRVKCILNKWGDVTLEYLPIIKEDDNVKLIISDEIIDSRDKYYYFKTSNRTLYDTAKIEANKKGYFESIFVNERNELTEGSFTNLFIKKGSKWFTPPVASGLLDGCYRKYLLKTTDNCEEKILKLSDITEADSIKLVNSVRREISVKTVDQNNKMIFRSSTI